jgi:hypothetical protein
MAIGQLGLYEITFKFTPEGANGCLMTSTTTTLANFTAYMYDYFPNAALPSVTHVLLNVTTVPLYIMPVSRSNATSPLISIPDPYFMVKMLPTVASINQQTNYLNSIATASDSTVGSLGPPTAGQLLAYNGSSWANTTITLPSATSFIRGYNVDNTTRTFTNSNQVGTYYAFDVFAAASYSTLSFSSDWTMTTV